MAFKCCCCWNKKIGQSVNPTNNNCNGANVAKEGYGKGEEKNGKLGFMNAIKSKVHYVVPLIYFVMVALTIIDITDLNNPFTGLIKLNFHHFKITYEYIKNN